MFWLLAAVAVLLLLAAWRLVPRPDTGTGTETGTRRGVDLAGTVTAVTGLVGLVVGAGLVQDPGSRPLAAGLLAAGAALLAVFVRTQHRGGDPLLGWAALTNGAFMQANGVAFVNTATTSASGTLR